MKSYLVLVADVYRCHFYRLAEKGTVSSLPQLVLFKSLANDELNSLENSVVNRPDRVDNSQHERSSPHGDTLNDKINAKGFDFAKQMIETVASIVRTEPMLEVVLVAGPQMIGMLRNGVQSVLPAHVKPKEFKKNLTTVSLIDLHDQLASEHFLPARRRLQGNPLRRTG